MNTEKVISNISAVLGIIGFFGTIIAGFLGDAFAAKIILWITIASVIVWLTAKVVSQGKELKALKSQGDTKFIFKKYFDDTIMVMSRRSNQTQVSSEFLNWDRGTILINVLVPPIGHGLRPAPGNRYILGHINDNNGGDDKERNFFGLRYSMRNKWEVDFSNADGERLPEIQWLSLEDGLEEGWHQFMVSWDRRKPEIIFVIDGNRRTTSSRFLNFWPVSFADSVTVGAWPTGYPESFVETKLSNLWVCNQALDENHQIVLEHRSIFRH